MLSNSKLEDDDCPPPLEDLSHLIKLKSQPIPTPTPAPVLISKPTVSSGLKKGFFNTQPSSSLKSNKTNLNSNSDLLPLLKPKEMKNPLMMDEVQQAMKEISPLTHNQGNHIPSIHNKSYIRSYHTVVSFSN